MAGLTLEAGEVAEEALVGQVGHWAADNVPGPHRRPDDGRGTGVSVGGGPGRPPWLLGLPLGVARAMDLRVLQYGATPQRLQDALRTAASEHHATAECLSSPTMRPAERAEHRRERRWLALGVPISSCRLDQSCWSVPL